MQMDLAVLFKLPRSPTKKTASAPPDTDCVPRGGMSSRVLMCDQGGSSLYELLVYCCPSVLYFVQFESCSVRVFMFSVRIYLTDCWLLSAL